MIAALVPAAGSSSRMGRPKLLVEFEGQSLIGRIVGELRAGGAERVVVVVPPASAPEGPIIAAEAQLAGAEVVVPQMRPSEMRASIELGLERLAQHTAPRSILLTPGDFPGITAELVSRVAEQAASIPDRIVIPRHAGRRGHPIVLPWAIAVQIPSLPPAMGVNSLVAQHADSVVEIEVASSDILADLDTPADLKNWEERQKSERRGRVNTESARPESGFLVPVRLFALAKDRAGCSELEVMLWPGSTVADLRAVLGKRLPALEPLLPGVMIAVDEEYADDNSPISRGSRLAVIPPVSGGAGEASTGRPNQPMSGGVLLR